ncbi:ABC transporter ATP-binding protein/permease [Aquabacter sp. P-9]|uniref:ABC transporter ATP-binding protein/permease n=1 Tax=Aquabacter sediminis TaxID=3029197 RepID=UPI00237D989C|nr:ABC transporter ATP-binding protein/permease [Aquabacter sp. P-9]MDE1566909.1 ABC transporter ATP-binding protein/permease [Aquabacter sp. P-9]
MKAFFTLLGDIRRLAIPYFKSEERWIALGLLGAVIALELAWVYATVLLNEWNSAFYNAIQEKNYPEFKHQLLIFCAIAVCAIAVAVYQIYLKQWLEIRWRRWLTTRYMGHWLTDDTHYRLRLSGDPADNPDQRIAQDVNLFVSQTIGVGIGLLGTVVSLISFSVILWGLSGSYDLQLFGTEMVVPGYLFWAALIYAAVGTWLAHLIGRPLVRLNYNQQRYEADFRVDLVRVRENSEQIALLKGEQAEERHLSGRFERIWGNFFDLMRAQKRLTWFTAGYNQISTIFPFVVVSPAYFSGAILLGPLMQTASAFSSVQGSFSFFITSYSTLAEWAAVVNRLTGFEASMVAAKAQAHTPAFVRTPVPASDVPQAVAMEEMDIRLPTDAPIIKVEGVSIARGEHVLVMGPSGSGKTTLFRAMAGIWPFGSGRLGIEAPGRLMILPQKPYVPVGRLDAALAYPQDPQLHTREEMCAVLEAVGLPGLCGRLDESGLWPHVLSLGEQQRLSLARALLAKPAILLLDEATAALDEPSEAAVYHLLRHRMAGTTLLSIGHRATLKGLHDRILILQGEGAPRRLVEAGAPVLAAEA